MCRSDSVFSGVSAFALVLLLLLLLATVASGQTTATETAEIPLPSGVTYVIVRAVDSAGNRSGPSNVVMVNQAAAAVRRFLWDANFDTPAAYVLEWGRQIGTWTDSATFPPGVLVPGRLPAPSLRIRAADE